MTVFLRACSRMARVFRFGMIGSTGLAIALQGFFFVTVVQDNPETLSRDEDEPLQAELDGDQLTVKAKKQPLVAVLVTVAEVLEVPAEIKYESTEIVDADIKKEPLEDVIPRLSPNVRLFVRADLTHSKRTPLRL